ncbi:MAG: SRPBCC family protein [Acidobacteriota bacterium]
MSLFKSVLSPAALAAVTLLAPSLEVFAQGAAQAPPPRIIGDVEVDKLTSAPLQLVRSVSLDASSEDVFAFIGDHSQWPGLLSAIETVSVAGSGRVGSTRSFGLAGGGQIAERIVAYSEPGPQGTATFAYSVNPGNPFGVQGHLAVLALRPADGGGTVLDYHQLFEHPDVSAILPVVAAGTDEIVSQILYRFGGELRGHSEASGGTVTIEVRRVVDVSSSRAWRVLGEMWGDVDRWASMISHSAVTEAKTKSSFDGATRSCEVPGTPGFRETMTAYDEDRLALTYRVVEGMPPFIANAQNAWKIRPISDRQVIVSSRITLDVAPGTPAVASAMAKGQFTQILDMTVDELVHFMETDRLHPRKLAAQQAAQQAAQGGP